jgi:TRAP-type C4-dicarboxylate transport system permease small subunit
MKAFLEIMSRILKVMNVIAGIALTFIILLTVCDVVLRAFGHPILGVYEIVAMAGGVIIGFVAPFTSWVRGHIFMDFVIQKLSPGARRTFNIVTRCVGIALFLMISWNVIKIATNFHDVGEVSNTLQIHSQRRWFLFLCAGCGSVLRHRENPRGDLWRWP